MTQVARVSDRRRRIVRWLLVVLLPLTALSIIRAFNAFRLPAAGPSHQHDRVLERDGRRYLFGGALDHEHFDITTFRLDPDKLHYGLGREVFPALITPQFETASQASAWLHDQDKVLTVKVNGTVRVYPTRLLMRHEVVNDIVEGIPIFAAYCVLADLGAVYDRRVSGQTLTFGVAGYTYADPLVWDGRDAFVLWDRETESLWWPPIGRAVSGVLLDRPLPLLSEKLWSQTTWGKTKEQHPDAQVLQPGQPFTPPVEWPRLQTSQFTCGSEGQPQIAPRWPAGSD